MRLIGIVFGPDDAREFSEFRFGITRLDERTHASKA
jgi:hypothetical protein